MPGKGDPLSRIALTQCFCLMQCLLMQLFQGRPALRTVPLTRGRMNSTSRQARRQTRRHDTRQRPPSQRVRPDVRSLTIYCDKKEKGRPLPVGTIRGRRVTAATERVDGPMHDRWESLSGRCDVEERFRRVVPLKATPAGGSRLLRGIGEGALHAISPDLRQRSGVRWLQVEGPPRWMQRLPNRALMRSSAPSRRR